MYWHPILNCLAMSTGRQRTTSVPTSTILSRSFTRGRVCLQEGGCAYLNHSIAFLHKDVQIYLCQREGVPTSTIPSRSFTRKYKSIYVRGRVCLPQPFHRVPSQGRTNLSVSEGGCAYLNHSVAFLHKEVQIYLQVSEGGCAYLNHSVAFLHKEVQIYLCEREGVPTSTIPSRSFTRTYKSICVRGRVCLPQPFHRVPSQGRTNLPV